MAFRAISQVATVLGYVVMVRGMSKEDFGVFNLLYSFIPLVSTVASLGLEQTLRRFQPEYLRSGNNAAAAWLLRFVATARLGTTAVVIALVLLTWNITAPLFKLTPYRLDFAFFSLLLLLYFQTRILQFSLASHMLHRYSVGSIVLVNVTKLLAYLALVSFDELTLQKAILVDTSAYALAFGWLQTARRRHCGPAAAAQKFRPDREERKRLLRYGFFNMLNDAGAHLINVRADNFFIAAMMNPVAVGAYAFCTRLNLMVSHLLPIHLFQNVVRPLFFATPPDRAEQRIPQYFTLLLNVNLALQLPLIAYATVYHREIVETIFGGKFIETSQLLPLVVALATTQNVISIPVTLVAQYNEKVSIILLSELFGIYYVCAMLLLVPIAGLYGAAIATGTSHIFRNLFVWWHVRGRARWTNFPSVLAMSVLIWGGTTIAAYTLKVVLNAPPIVDMICGVLVCGIAGLLYVRSPAIASSDRELLAGVFRGREAHVLRILRILPRESGQEGRAI